MGPAMPHEPGCSHMTFHWSLVPWLAAASLAHAATVDVRVANAAGQPLGGAVVMLQPASGKLPVQPLGGVQIAQARRQFNPAVTVVTVGTAVSFPNLDSVRHHVYSFSSAKSFELKLYAGVPAAPVVFDKPGVAVLGCNIHDRMVAWVVVVDTPLYGVSAADGHAQLAAVPAGDYQLQVWHAGLRSGSPAPAQALHVGAADLSPELRLDTETTP